MDQNFFFKSNELLITKKTQTPFRTGVSLETLQNFKGNRQAVLVLELKEHDNLWFLHISLLVHHQNFTDTLLLRWLAWLV